MESRLSDCARKQDRQTVHADELAWIAVIQHTESTSVLEPSVTDSPFSDRFQNYSIHFRSERIETKMIACLSCDASIN